MFGIVGMVAGTIVSVKDIVDFFVHPPAEGNYPKCHYNDTTTSDDIAWLSGNTMLNVSNIILNHTKLYFFNFNVICPQSLLYYFVFLECPHQAIQ